MRKLSKAAVHYRRASSEARRCGTCAMYQAGGRCTLVLGPIDRNDVCDRWTAKGWKRVRSSYRERWAEVRRREAEGRPMRHPRRYVFTGEE